VRLQERQRVLQLRLRLVLPVVLAFTAIAAMLTRLAVRAQRQRPSTGADAMVGSTGETLTIVDASGGRISTHGEIWQAVAADPIAPGSRVRVTRVDGLRLHVCEE